jgi:hypothetical protein
MFKKQMVIGVLFGAWIRFETDLENYYKSIMMIYKHQTHIDASDEGSGSQRQIPDLPVSPSQRRTFID